MIRQAVEKDLLEISKVHIECFPNSFSTALGKPLFSFLNNSKVEKSNPLTKFYKEYLSVAPELFLVAENEHKKIEGFCMGYYCENNNYMKNYFKHNFMTILFRIMFLLLTADKSAWGKIKSIFYKKKSFRILDEQTHTIPLNARGNILSICVLPKNRGSGMAQELISTYELVLRKQKRKVCTLTVSLNNGRGVRFYEKNGYLPYRAIGSNVRTYAKALVI